MALGSMNLILIVSEPHRRLLDDDVIPLGREGGMIGLDTWIGSAPSYRKHPHSLVSYNKFYPFRGDTKMNIVSSETLMA